ncbi:hypothetical protein GEMRC1_005689 [Eukaryota sp. GEM-RC1]
MISLSVTKQLTQIAFIGGVPLLPVFFLFFPSPSWKQQYSLSSISYIPLVFCSPWPNLILLPRLYSRYSLTSIADVIQGNQSAVDWLYAVDLLATLIVLGYSKNGISLSSVGKVSEKIVSTFFEFMEDFPLSSGDDQSVESLSVLILERGLDFASIFGDNKSAHILSKVYSGHGFGSQNDVILTGDHIINPIVSDPLFNSIFSDLEPQTRQEIFFNDVEGLTNEIIENFEFFSDIHELFEFSEISSKLLDESTIDQLIPELNTNHFALLRLLLSLKSANNSVDLDFENVYKKYFATRTSFSSAFSKLQTILRDSDVFDTTTNPNLLVLTWELLFLTLSHVIPADSETIRLSFGSFQSFLTDWIVDYVIDCQSFPKLVGLSEDCCSILSLLIEENNQEGDLNQNLIKQSKMILNDDIDSILCLLSFIPSLRLDLPFATIPSKGLIRHLIDLFLTLTWGSINLGRLLEAQNQLV